MQAAPIKAGRKQAGVRWMHSYRAIMGRMSTHGLVRFSSVARSSIIPLWSPAIPYLVRYELRPLPAEVLPGRLRLFLGPPGDARDWNVCGFRVDFGLGVDSQPERGL